MFVDFFKCRFTIAKDNVSIKLKEHRVRLFLLLSAKYRITNQMHKAI